MVKRIARSGGSRLIVGGAAAAAAPVVPQLTPLEEVNQLMTPILDEPTIFYAPSQQHAQTCIKSSKLLYDLSKTSAPEFLSVDSSVPTLVTHTRPTASASSASSSSANTKPIPFSNEQIYAQLSMHTTPLLQRMEQQIKVLQQHVTQAQAAAAEAEEDQPAEDEEEEEDDAADEEQAMEDDENMDDGEDDEDMGEDEENEDGEDEAGDHADEDADAGEYRGRGGVTEDAFFSLDDMEKFADMYEGSEDEGQIDDEEGMQDEEDEERDGEDEDEEEEDEDDDDAMDLAALRAKSIRAKHESSLKPFAQPLKDIEVDLEEDLGENEDFHYRDFFDAPPKELLGKKGRKGGNKSKSLEEMYADEDKQEYVDDDAMDEFGGAFRSLSTSAREGTLGSAEIGGTEAEKEIAAAGDAEPIGPESSYERSQRKLREQISTIEKKLVQPREWAQLGEVTGKARPMDSLLDTNLEFEHAGKVAPVITQEYTEELESMIRRRIAKEDFNDVVRKLESDLHRKKKPSGQTELNEEKSAIGLAEVYEQEYIAEQKAAEGAPSADQEKLSKEHEVIAGLVGALFHKLDAMCNFHFTPRSIHADELEITTKPQVSAIQMEEVLPTHMSSATHTAPQELYDVSEKAMVGASEHTSEEKKSRHRRIKAQKKKAYDAGLLREKERMKAMGKAATEGNAAEGILRKAISSKEMKAATTARNVIQAGGKGAGPSSSNKKNLAIGHGQNTKFSNSSAFFGKIQSEGGPNKKQKTTR